MKKYLIDGRPLYLKDAPFATGGEGMVYELKDDTDYLAKIYSDVHEAQKREAKIKELVRFSRTNSGLGSNTSDCVAWPLYPVFDDPSGTQFIGFVMKKFDAISNLASVYQYPAQTTASYSIEDRISWMISLYELVDKLHTLNLVIGDFNPNNILLLKSGKVAFIDVDSFQIKSKANADCRCVVCAPGYVAPEVIRLVKGTTYEQYPGVVFTRKSDYFSLAVHCFRMLMNGCHPYTCARISNIGSTPAPISEDKRVERGETPFFTSVPNYKPPVYVPTVSSLPPYLYNLFVRAFVDGHIDPVQRPSATEWKINLKYFLTDLKKCDQVPIHFYWERWDQMCPYCKADDDYRRFFNLPIPFRKQSAKPVSVCTSSAKPAPTLSNATQPVPARTSVTPQTVGSSGSSTNPSTLPRSIPSTKESTSLDELITFWIVTIVLSGILSILLGRFVLAPSLNKLCSENNVQIEEFEKFVEMGYVDTITIWSCIAGLVGSCIYNMHASIKQITDSDYFISPLLALIPILILYFILIGFCMTEILAINNTLILCGA